MSDLIDRESLLNIVGKMPLNWEYGQAVSDIYDIILKQPTVEAKPVEWIPCSERLPVKDGWYLTTVIYGSVKRSGMCNFVNGEWEHFDVGFNDIAWMPLPQPYNADMRKKVE